MCYRAKSNDLPLYLFGDKMEFDVLYKSGYSSNIILPVCIIKTYKPPIATIAQTERLYHVQVDEKQWKIANVSILGKNLK